MKYIFLLLLGGLIWVFPANATPLLIKVYDITRYGAVGNGVKLNTGAINAAIDDCSKNGGGIVRVPKGVFLSGTIYLKSNIRLRLEEGAVIQGTADIDQYHAYAGSASLAKYNSGDAGPNANSIMNNRWGKGLIIGNGISNVSIEGQGVIDGAHAFDSLGEERMRGPHTIIIGESRNITLTGITINRSANYAFLAYDIENAGFDNLQMNEGWDGIHIRGGKNILIRNCSFYTGDDAIAGGYWENIVISNCFINSSCNGIRVIMPATRLTIEHCIFKGPGKYPHRTSKELRRTNMLSAILLQPGGWGKAPGRIQDVHVHDISITDMNNPFMLVLNEGNEGDNIRLERITATGIRQAAASIESWRGGVFGRVQLKDISISYAGKNEPKLRDLHTEQPPADSRPLPAWAFFVRNVRNISFENVTLSYEGAEQRPAFLFDNVGAIEFNNVNYPGIADEHSVLLRNTSPFKRK
ncbi:MAG: glycoside hydrolase family 28 protein [Pseudobacter sp.]|uniref:glycoside hydrolase family 28 protein n=1 Tax=Pseudobacter sp. TaxID=2045420 RepID=UPI003F811704